MAAGTGEAGGSAGLAEPIEGHVLGVGAGGGAAGVVEVVACDAGDAADVGGAHLAVGLGGAELAGEGVGVGVGVVGAAAAATSAEQVHLGADHNAGGAIGGGALAGPAVVGCCSAAVHADIVDWYFSEVAGAGAGVVVEGECSDAGGAVVGQEGTGGADRTAEGRNAVVVVVAGGSGGEAGVLVEHVAGFAFVADDLGRAVVAVDGQGCAAGAHAVDQISVFRLIGAGADAGAQVGVGDSEKGEGGVGVAGGAVGFDARTDLAAAVATDAGAGLLDQRVGALSQALAVYLHWSRRTTGAVSSRVGTSGALDTAGLADPAGRVRDGGAGGAGRSASAWGQVVVHLATAAAGQSGAGQAVVGCVVAEDALLRSGGVRQVVVGGAGGQAASSGAWEEVGGVAGSSVAGSAVGAGHVAGEAGRGAEGAGQGRLVVAIGAVVVALVGGGEVVLLGGDGCVVVAAEAGWSVSSAGFAGQGAFDGEQDLAGVLTHQKATFEGRHSGEVGRGRTARSEASHCETHLGSPRHPSYVHSVGRLGGDRAAADEAHEGVAGEGGDREGGSEFHDEGGGVDVTEGSEGDRQGLRGAVGCGREGVGEVGEGWGEWDRERVGDGPGGVGAELVAGFGLELEVGGAGPSGGRVDYVADDDSELYATCDCGKCDNESLVAGLGAVEGGSCEIGAGAGDGHGDIVGEPYDEERTCGEVGLLSEFEGVGGFVAVDVAGSVDVYSCEVCGGGHLYGHAGDVFDGGGGRPGGDGEGGDDPGAGGVGAEGGQFKFDEGVGWDGGAWGNVGEVDLIVISDDGVCGCCPYVASVVEGVLRVGRQVESVDCDCSWHLYRNFASHWNRDGVVEGKSIGDSSLIHHVRRRCDWHCEDVDGAHCSSHSCCNAGVSLPSWSWGIVSSDGERTGLRSVAGVGQTSHSQR